MATVGPKTVKTMKLVGKDLSVDLTPYQIGRISAGACSTYTNNNLIAIGVGHSTLKALDGKLGDNFQKILEIHTPDLDGDFAQGAEPEIKKTNHVGPTDRINFHQMRVLLFKQFASDGQAYYLHVCYDADKVVFVSDKGKCLYIYRYQLLD